MLKEKESPESKESYSAVFIIEKEEILQKTSDRVAAEPH